MVIFSGIWTSYKHYLQLTCSIPEKVEEMVNKLIIKNAYKYAVLSNDANALDFGGKRCTLKVTLAYGLS